MLAQPRLKRPRYFSVLITILFIGVGAIVFQKLGCNEVQAFCQHASSSVQTSSTETIAANYVVYSPSALESAKQKGKTLLYFWAPWCSTCTSLDLDLQAKTAIVPDGITVLRVPYDQSPELKKQYNVTVQHTFVQVDKNDKALSTWVGGGVENFAKYVK